MPQQFNLFPNTKPAKGEYLGVISGLLRNVPPLAVLSSDSVFNIDGAVDDATSYGAKLAKGGGGSSSAPEGEKMDILEKLCESTRQALEDEAVVISVNVAEDESLVLVGDIHGQFRDMQTYVLSPQRDVIAASSGSSSSPKKDCKFLFLGDYVDRGPQGIEVVALLLALKVEYPNNVFLLRGNHEEATVCRMYGFLQECRAKLSPNAWGTFNNVFCFLPLGAVVEATIVDPVPRNGAASGTGTKKVVTFFCCHGGLNPYISAVQALQFIRRSEYGQGMLDGDDSEVVDGLLWSDPAEHDGFRRNMRGCGFTFGSNTTAEFCESNAVKFVCRAHQMVMDGFHWDHDGKLLTVFSAPNYCGCNDNKGAIAVLGAVTPSASASLPPGAANIDNDASAAAITGIEGALRFETFPSAPEGLCVLYYANPTSNPEIDLAAATATSAAPLDELPASPGAPPAYFSQSQSGADAKEGE